MESMIIREPLDVKTESRKRGTREESDIRIEGDEKRVYAKETRDFVNRESERQGLDLRVTFPASTLFFLMVVGLRFLFPFALDDFRRLRLTFICR